jgi:hypothetical protein
MNQRIASVLCLAVMILSACSWVQFPGGNPAIPTEVQPPLPSETPEAISTKGPIATSISPMTPTPTTQPTQPVAIPTQDLPNPTATPIPGPRFVLQAGTPLGISNFVSPEVGCAWMGVGGQVFDFSGNAVSSLVVEAGGELLETTVSKLSMSGSTSAFGPGGYVVQLGEQPVASDGTVWIRLLDLGGAPLTEKIYITTYSDCERNLVLLNFAEVGAQLQPRVFLPSILSSTPIP